MGEGSQRVTPSASGAGAPCQDPRAEVRARVGVERGQGAPQGELGDVIARHAGLDEPACPARGQDRSKAASGLETGDVHAAERTS